MIREIEHTTPTAAPHAHDSGLPVEVYLREVGPNGRSVFVPGRSLPVGWVPGTKLIDHPEAAEDWIFLDTDEPCSFPYEEIDAENEEEAALG